MKFLVVGAELFHADGQTDVMNLIVAFLNFVGGLAKSGKRLVTGWTARGSNPGGDEIFRQSRPALGPTQLSVQ